MATRQDRLLERMRGARMHQVEDISFGFELPEPEPVESEEPSGTAAESSTPVPAAPVAPPAPVRPPPNTSAKRARSERNAARARISPSQPARTTRSSLGSPPQPVAAPARRPDIYDIQSYSTTDGIARSRQSPRRSSGMKQVSILEPEEHADTTESPAVVSSPSSAPAPSSSPASLQPRSTRRSALARSPLAAVVSAEEVAESPADAPGSGRRRTLEAGSRVVGSSVLLQKMLEDVGESVLHPPSSSPLQRVAAARRAGLGPSPTAGGTQRRSVRLSAGSSAGSLGGYGEEDELTPDGPRKRNVEVKKARYKPNGEKRASVEAAQEIAAERTDGETEEQVAEEIGDQEAAQRLATRKRPRRSLPAASPELSSAPPGIPEPSVKRRKKELASPARQQQPKPKPPKSKPAKKQAAPGKKTARSSAANDQEGDEADGPAVSVTVQRFTKRAAVAEDDPDADILGAEIPFANRAGVNAVDVLSTLCEELIETFLEKLAGNVRNAEDAAARREQRTMLRSLEAFQEELRTRLLEHTIALDSLHALRKRVRAAQKEKLSLRDEILRTRAERDQVALRMDAIRIRHEAESKEALRHISLSTAMHDIDLVVEKAQAAEELSSAEQKEAELANLELLISRISDQACSKSDSGGALKQIKEFNAFLERTAGVLERR